MFLYTKNKLFEREINKAISLTIASKTIKHLRINLIKKYTENYTTLIKETENSTKKWNSILCSWGGIMNTENVHTTKSKTQIQCNIYQDFNDIFFTK